MNKTTKQYEVVGDPIIDNIIAKDSLNTKFLTKISPNDSMLLEPNRIYGVISVIENLDPLVDFRRELVNYIKVLPEGGKS